MSKLSFLVTSIALSAVLVPSTSHAGLFDSWADPLIEMMEITSETMLELSDDIGEMSDDIGTMADRIGVMADRIGVMADRIGVMSERIVTTEKLLAETLLALQQQSSGSTEVIMLDPQGDDEISRATPPIISLSDGASAFLLYASMSPSFPPDDRLTLLVKDQADLEQAWAQVVAYAGDEVYIAVKSINPQLSARSNSVRLILVD